MKALSKRTERARTENEANTGYAAVQEAAPEIMAQAIAVMLFALSKHGYGVKRLNDFYDWYCAMMDTPTEMLGKTPKAMDVMSFMSSKYGMDFERVKPKFKPFKEWYRDGS